MKATILDIRHNMGDILKAIDRNENITLTYRGHEKAVIIPVKKTSAVNVENHPAFGLWRNRTDFNDVDNVLRKIRKGRLNAF